MPIANNAFNDTYPDMLEGPQTRTFLFLETRILTILLIQAVLPVPGGPCMIVKGHLMTCLMALF